MNMFIGLLIGWMIVDVIKYARTNSHIEFSQYVYPLLIGGVLGNLLDILLR